MRLQSPLHFQHFKTKNNKNLMKNKTWSSNNKKPWKSKLLSHNLWISSNFYSHCSTLFLDSSLKKTIMELSDNWWNYFYVKCLRSLNLLSVKLKKLKIYLTCSQFLKIILSLLKFKEINLTWNNLANICWMRIWLIN
jgi:hypothetical protein